MTSVRVYEFGLLAPTQNAHLVDEQILLSHRYRNVLVEIERQRRETIRQATNAHSDIAPLEEQIRALTERRDAAREMISAKRKASRRRSESTEDRKVVRDLNEQLKPLCEQSKALRDRIKATRQSLTENPDLVTGADDEIVRLIKATDAANEYAHQRLIQARKVCGVYWSTYLLQEAAADQARKEVTPPHFVRWSGEGRVSVQLQGGLPLDDVWGTDTQIRIARPAPAAHDPGTRRGDRRRAARTELHMRVGSLDRKPVWAVWPMVYHRPIPDGAVVKVATVTKRRRDSTAWDWRVHVTVDVSACAPRRAVPEAGVVALNMGFAFTPSGAIRSGYMVGDDGEQQEILLLKSDAYRGRDLTADQLAELARWIPQGLAKAESIRSHRDKAQDLMRALLCAWKSGELDRAAQLHRDLLILQTGEHRVGSEGAPTEVPPRVTLLPIDQAILEIELAKRPVFPEWFHKATEAMHAWQSQERFRRLLAQWTRVHHDAEGAPITNRFAGDQLGVWILQAWIGRDTHLECYEGGLRRSALRDRREGYRILASRMAQRYKTLLIDGTDLSTFQRSPAVEDEHEIKILAVKYNQRMAACSELRDVMINAFGIERVVKHKHHNLSRTCHGCGHINTPWTPLEDASRSHTCVGCGVTWDQDANFCRNLLTLHRRGEETEPDTRKPSRSQRFAQAKRKAA